MKARPRTGERREVRQPLKIDRLPQAMRDQVLKLRAQEGLTWEQIEERSPKLDGWEEMPPKLLALFPARRLPHSSLQRWYDLRIEQVQKEILAETERARELAAAFAARGFKDLPDAIQNALRDEVFTLMRAVDSKSQDKFQAALTNLGYLVAQFQKNKIAQQKVEAESRRIHLMEEEAERKRKRFEKETNEAASKLEKGKTITREDINRLRERVFGLPPVEAAGSHPA